MYYDLTDELAVIITTASLNAHQKIAQIEQLAKQGASLKKRYTSRGFTLLHVAAIFGNWQLILYLRSKGLNEKAVDNFGRTPLRIFKDVKRVTYVNSQMRDNNDPKK